MTLPQLQAVKTRRGPKAKSISERTLRPKDLRPIRYPEHTYSRYQKVRVLLFLEHYRIPVSTRRGGYLRHPSQQEASDVYNVPRRTISDWVKDKKLIESVGINSPDKIQTREVVSHRRWPELEERLYQDFAEWRKEGRIVRRGWFRVQALFRFRELFPQVDPVVFRFSDGWFHGFLGRHKISLRIITKKAQKVPAEYQSLVINWLRFNRCNSQPFMSPPYSSSFFDIVLQPPVGRYELSNIGNLDETPIPYEYLDGKTYNIQGEKTIWAKSGQNGWDKRQASLVLCVFADEVPRVPPLVIFRGRGERLGNEKDQYHPGVEVAFNDKAYMNDSLFLTYIENQLVPVLGSRPTLFSLDLMGSHKTPAVLEKLKAYNITPSLIPGGCTSLVQPLDVAITKLFKDRIRDLTDTAICEAETLESFRRWAVRERRILTTSCVGDAYYAFHLEKGDIIRQVFRKVGLSLPIDGSCDAELDIKGFSGLQIGDWRVHLGALDLVSDISNLHDNNEHIDFVHSDE